MDVEHIVGDNEDHRLREELCSCHYFLVDSEVKRARHRVFNYAVESLNEMNLGFSFTLKNKEDGVFRFLRTRKQYPAGSIQTCVHP